MKTTCNCGWQIDYLLQERASTDANIAAIKADSHPFQAAMLDGAKQRLATINAHLAEVAAPAIPRNVARIGNGLYVRTGRRK